MKEERATEVGYLTKMAAMWKELYTELKEKE